MGCHTELLEAALDGWVSPYFGEYENNHRVFRCYKGYIFEKTFNLEIVVNSKEEMGQAVQDIINMVENNDGE